MKNNNKSHILIQQVSTWFAIICLFLTSGCSENWEKHYDENKFNLNDLTLFQYIESRADLSTFSRMLKLTGYDSLINVSQTFTIWAPTNDALVAVDTGNLDLVLKIVTNHIARFSFSTAHLSAKNILMLSKRRITMSQNSNVFVFGDQTLIESDIPVKNGLVHIINGYVPFNYNIREYIKYTPGFDSLQVYLASKDIEITTQGDQIDGSSNNETVFRNTVLDTLRADIENEDSVYSVILPNNTAWNKAYDSIAPYYKMQNATVRDIIRKNELTKFSIIQDMVFRGKINSPDSYGVADSLVSTNGNVFFNPEYLFNGSIKETVSNGLVYTTNQMKYPPTKSWHKEIRVEAENEVGRYIFSASIFLRSSVGSKLDVSKEKYIIVEPTSTSSATAVRFQIPNVLSAKYRIYCVFVPAAYIDSTIANNLKPQRPEFTLIYTDQTGKSKSEVISGDTTEVYTLTKMFVKEITFPFCNIPDEINTQVNTYLKIANTVKVSETTKLSRTMRIDCIILEPVE
jgi:hypothetical protein